MRILFSRSLVPYVLGIFVLIALTGAVLSRFVDDYIMLISVLSIEFIIFIIFLLQVFYKHIHPIQKATKTMEELVKGNYRARIHHPFNGSIGELSRLVNTLARNLSELSINEQMQAEQLSTVIDNTESGLVLIDDKGYIHLVNRKFLSMFGQTQRDYVGYLYYDVLEQVKIHEVVQNTFLYEENVKDIFTTTQSKGRQFIEIVGAPIFDERNVLKGAVLVFYDITELKNVELMRKDFVANVSHELRTPVTSIAGFAETLLEEDMSDWKTNQKFIQIIYDESKRLQLLIDDLLILSRLERDGFQLNLGTINLSTITAEIFPVFKQKALDRKIELKMDIQDTELIADREKIKQILINLIANAISYTPENGKVELNVTEHEKSVVMTISDTGIGIPEELIPRIFERFYRIDKDRSRNTGGTGLGLAIVRHIVELHHGDIEVESKVNEGTTFKVILPKDLKR